MTHCSNCEEWVELDDGKCPQCDKVLLKKKKVKGRTDDMDFMDDEPKEDEDEIVSLDEAE